MKAAQLPVRLCALVVVTLNLTACAPMLSLFGTNQALVQVVAQVERLKLAGDGASYVASSKTITDHALSGVLGKNCKVFNLVTEEPVCSDNRITGSAKKPSATPDAETTSPSVAQAALVSSNIATSTTNASN